MSEIRKELKLFATLDDSKFRQQLADLKKELGTDLAPNNMDLSDLKRTFSEISASFSKEFQNIIKDLKQQLGKINVDVNAPGVQNIPREASNAIGETRQTIKDNSGKSVEIINEKAIKEFHKDQADSIRDVEQYREWNDQSLKRSIKQSYQIQQESEKEKIALNKKLEQETKKRAKEEQRAEKEKQKLAAKSIDTLAGGAGSPRGPGGTEEPKEDMSRKLFGYARRVRMAGTVGAIGYGISGVTKSYMEIRQIQAERAYQFAADTVQGRALEGAIRKGGRNEFLPQAAGATGGGLAGAAGGAAAGAAIGSAILPGIGTVAGGIIGGLGGGYFGAKGGQYATSQLWGETRVKEAEPILTALDYARSLRPQRLEAFRGTAQTMGAAGAVSNLNQLQSAGASRMFSPEETIQQFLEARSAFGGQTASKMLGGMQDIYNLTGTNVGQQTQAMDVLTGMGARGNRSYATTGMEKQKQIIQKAVSAGLDISRSGKVLQEVSAFLQSQAGVAPIQESGVTNRLLERARAFAGGGEITNFDINRARTVEEEFRQESRNPQSLGNWAGLLDAKRQSGLQMNFVAMSRLLNTSNTASKSQVKSILESSGVQGSEDQINEFIKVRQKSAQNPYQTAAQVFGNMPGLAEMLYEERTGRTAEESQDVFRAQRGMTPLAPGQALPQDQVRQTLEGQQAIEEAQIQVTQFSAAAKEFNSSLEQTRKGFDSLVGSLIQAKVRLDSQFGVPHERGSMHRYGEDISGPRGIHRTNTTK